MTEMQILSYGPHPSAVRVSESCSSGFRVPYAAWFRPFTMCALLSPFSFRERSVRCDWVGLGEKERGKGQLRRSSSVILTEKQYIFSKPTKFSKPIAIAQKGKLILIKKCKKNWCKTSNKEISGWILFKDFWGKLPN